MAVYKGNAHLRKARNTKYKKIWNTYREHKCGRDANARKPVYRHQTIETLKVARWSVWDLKQKLHRGCDVWMVGRKRKLRIRKGSRRMQQLFEQLGVDPKDLAFETTRAGFLYGRILRDLIATIKTSSGPGIGYRVVHGSHPYGGIKVRGYGVRTTNPIYMQRDVQGHLQCRDRFGSQFMSITSDYMTAIRKCAFYYVRGYEDIKILAIKTSGPGWDYKLQKMWHVKELVRKFKLPWKAYFKNEWLVEHSIPESQIIGEESWEAIRDKYLDVEKKVRAKYLREKRKDQDKKEERSRKGKEERKEARRLEPLDRTRATDFPIVAHDIRGMVC